MIRVSIQRNADQAITNVRVEGHAGFANHGEDIVCAAISALAMTTVLGLERVAKQKGTYSVEYGTCHMVLTDEITQSGQDILETMLIGMKETSKEYPKFVSISEM